MADKASRRVRFEKIYARIADELIVDLRNEKIPEEIISRYRKVRSALFVETCC
jgi:farnesyl diphosphate synthase